MNNEIWVYCPYDGLSFSSDSFSLIQKAKSLSSSLPNSSVVAVVVAPDVPKESELLGTYGADLVRPIICTGSELSAAHVLSDMARAYKPDIILFSAKVREFTIAARAAAELGAGLTADCTGLSITDDGSLLQTRPAFGGGLIADILTKSRPQMSTVRPGSFPHAKALYDPCPVEPPYSPISGAIADPIKMLKFELFAAQNSIRDANIIVSGGRGVGTRDGFKLLGTLAEKLGGMVGASRAAVDAGLASWNCQVGQTGITVSPRVYIAFGISGAFQHIAGMATSKFIVAVNNDKKAPIFDYADVAIIEDWREVAEEMIAHF